MMQTGVSELSSSTMSPSDLDLESAVEMLATNCSHCLNKLCLTEEDYKTYESWVGVDTYEMILITLNVVVFVAGIVGNSLVFIAVTTTKSMQSVTNIFIVNLALADILVMLFCAPPSIIWDVTNTWVFGSLMCRIVIYIQDISVSVSVLTLTFIAYDRYHAICRPLQFSSRRTKAAAVIACIWSISAMIGIPDAVTLQLVSPFKDGNPCRDDDILFDLSSCRPSWSENFDFFFTLLKAVLLYTIPLVFMSVAYYHIVRTLWRRNGFPPSSGEAGSAVASSNNAIATGNDVANGSTTALLSRSATMRASTRSGASLLQESASSARLAPSASNAGSGANSSSVNRNLDNQLRTRRKVAKMLIAVVIMFFINFFPVHLLPIVNYIVDNTLVQGSPAHERFTQVLMYAGIITHCMVYFNSAINPIIYYFMSAQFKAQYRRILSCRCTADAPSPKAQRTLLQQEAAAGGPGGGGNAGANSSARRDMAAGARVLRSRSCMVPTGPHVSEHSSSDGGASRVNGSAAATRRVMRHPSSLHTHREGQVTTTTTDLPKLDVQQTVST